MFKHDFFYHSLKQANVHYDRWTEAARASTQQSRTVHRKLEWKDKRATALTCTHLVLENETLSISL